MTETPKIAIYRLDESTPPTGLVTGTLGVYTVVLSTDGTPVAVPSGIDPETAILAGVYHGDAPLSAETTLATPLDLWTPEGEETLSGWWDASDWASLTFSTGSTVSAIASRIQGGVDLAQNETSNWRMDRVVSDPDFQNKQVLVPRADWATENTVVKKGYIAASAIDVRAVFVVTSFMAGNASTYPDHKFLFGNWNSSFGEPRMMGEGDQSGWLASNTFAASGRTNGSAGLATLPMDSSVLYFEAASTTSIQLCVNFWAANDNRTWSGPFAEMIVLDAAPDSTLIQKIEGYLAHKWGIASALPGGHPYKSTPPTV